MDPLPRNTDYDNLTPAEYVKKWLDDPSIEAKSKAEFRDHIRDNGPDSGFSEFEKAVTDEFEKQTKARKKIAETQQRIKQSEHADLVDRVWGEDE